jgi:hypothetical protein
VIAACHFVRIMEYIAVNKTEIECVLDNMIVKDIYRGQCLIVNDFVGMVSFVV